MESVTQSVKWSEPLEGWKHLKFWKHGYRKLARDLEYVDYTPSYSLLWKPFDLTKPDQVKVVILGTEPYSAKDANNGLAFSTRANTSPLPLSLRNIFEELTSDLGLKQPRNGDLTPWAQRGVLLLNISLTRPRDERWKALVFEVLRYLSETRTGIVYMLWGGEAQEFTGAIDGDRNLVITSSHPGLLESPISGAKNTFLGSRPFSAARNYNPEINMDYWRL
jgi:uracil-DNA glycosylase